MGLRYKPIQAKKFDEVHYFVSIRACAKALEIHPARAVRAMKCGVPANGWSITEFDGDVSLLKGSGLPNLLDSVIATTQNGTHVFFPDVDTVIDYLKCSRNSLTHALKGKKALFGGWKWMYDDGTIKDAVPYNDSIGCTFEVLMKPTKKVKETPDEEEDEDNDEGKFEGREVLATGFYDPEYSPTICPICGKVICSDIKHEDVKGSKHLTKCLKHYDYSIKNGLITVYKPL